MENLTVVVAIGGSADAADVARHLKGGRAEATADRRTLVFFGGVEDALEAVTGYLKPRAMSFVRFGVHVGDSRPAERLADRARGGRVWLSPEAREQTERPVEQVDDDAYELRRI